MASLYQWHIQKLELCVLNERLALQLIPIVTNPQSHVNHIDLLQE